MKAETFLKQHVVRQFLLRPFTACLFFMFFGISAQEAKGQNWTGWSQWTSASCYDAITYRSRTRPSSDNKVYVQMEIKNNFPQGISIAHFIANDPNRSSIYRIEISSGGVYTSEQYVNADRKYYLILDKLRFSGDKSSDPYRDCKGKMALTEQKTQAQKKAQATKEPGSTDNPTREQQLQAAKGEIDKMQTNGQISEQQAQMAKAEIDKMAGQQERTKQNTTNSDNNGTETKREKTSSEIYKEYMEEWAKKDAEIQRKGESVGNAVNAAGNLIAASQGIDGAKSLVWKWMLPSDMRITANNFLYEIQPGTSGKFFYGTFGFGVGTASYEAKNPSPYAESDDLDDVETSGLGATAECSLGLRFPFYKKDWNIAKGAIFCGVSGDYSMYFDDQDVNPMVYTLGAFAGVNIMHFTIQFGGGMIYNDLSGDLVNYKADSGYAGKSGMLYIKAGFVW